MIAHFSCNIWNQIKHLDHCWWCKGVAHSSYWGTLSSFYCLNTTAHLGEPVPWKMKAVLKTKGCPIQDYQDVPNKVPVSVNIQGVKKTSQTIHWESLMEIVYLQVVTLLDLPLSDTPLFPFYFIYFYSYNYVIVSAAVGILLGQLGSTCPCKSIQNCFLSLWAGSLMVWGRHKCCAKPCSHESTIKLPNMEVSIERMVCGFIWRMSCKVKPLRT